MSELKCRVCGCTWDNACITDFGPCWWVEVDLCSACADDLWGGTRTKILNDIHQERTRQNHLHPQKLNLAMRFVTFMEEAGEVAEAMQNKDKKAFYRELIDTAASCVRLAGEVLQDD